uniref:NADH dehydrogenase subunit 4L n=1 Tax=Blasticotoma filiceti TaxID=1141352 RepID=UPI0021FD42E4|nr:NADH dehydrogenase subunit 4L [Blasticotoma filiceti]UXW93447.1 NADH dehydrogenase subunit 4L [Blasticotoma filiceti]
MIYIMNFSWLIMLFMFLSGFYVFCSKFKHLLVVLLSLEFMVLSIYMILFIYLNLLIYESYFSMIFLVFSVCEGVLGISILISMIRSYGNDFYELFNLIKC